MRTLAILSLLYCGAIELPAQTATSFELGALNIYDESLLQLGVRVGQVRPGTGGVEGSLATLPDAIADGVFLLLADVGAAFAIPAGDGALLPRFGVSLIGGAGGGAFGYYVGLGALARFSPRMGLRLDYTRRRLLGVDEPRAFSSVTIGIAWIR